MSQVQICPVDHRVDPDRPRRVPEGSMVCGGCIERVRRSVRDLPALHVELGDVLGGVKRSGGAGPVTGSAEAPLPINPAIAEHRTHMRLVVMSWCLTVSDTYGVALPHESDLSATCPWLLTYIDWACRQEWAQHFVTEIRHLAGRARGLIDPQEQSNIRLGPCVEDTPAEDGTLVPCRGELWGTFREDDPRPWLIECSECGKEWISEMWLRLGHLIEQRKTKETAS